MPAWVYGLASLPYTFESAIKHIFNHRTSLEENVKFPLSQYLVTYLDDFCLFSNSINHMFELLECFFERCSLYNLKLNPEKSIFFQPEIEFLGYTMSKDGLSPAKSKMKIIAELISPPDAKKPQDHLYYCLGFFSFNKKFIPNFAHLSAPLYAILGKKEFSWSPVAEENF